MSEIFVRKMGFLGLIFNVWCPKFKNAVFSQLENSYGHSVTIFEISHFDTKIEFPTLEINHEYPQSRQI